MSRRDGEDSVHFGLDDGIEIREPGTSVLGSELPTDSAVRGIALGLQGLDAVLQRRQIAHGPGDVRLLDITSDELSTEINRQLERV